MAKKSASEFDMLALSYHLKKSPLYEGLHVEMMYPDWITATPDDMISARRPDKNGLGVADYIKTAPYLSDIADRLMSGEVIDDIMKEDSRVGQAANQYFNPSNMIRADVYGGDEIRLDGRGVQQLLAAQRCDVPVPVLSVMQPEMTFEREMELMQQPVDDGVYEEPWFMREQSQSRRLPDLGDMELYEDPAEEELWDESENVPPGERELYDEPEAKSEEVRSNRRFPRELPELPEERDSGFELDF